MDEEQGAVVETGSKVHLRLSLEDGGFEDLEVTLVGSESSDLAAGHLGADTPLGQTIFGRRAGESIPYRQGDIVSVTIEQVQTAMNAGDPEAAGKRREALDKARADIDRTNAQVFAASFSGKWGDYDPNAVADEPQKEDEDRKSGS